VPPGVDGLLRLLSRRQCTLDLFRLNATNKRIDILQWLGLVVFWLGGTQLRLPTEGWQGWVELGGWLYAEIGFWHRVLNPGQVTHPSTNRARRTVTSLIETNVLTLSQTAKLISAHNLAANVWWTCWYFRIFAIKSISIAWSRLLTYFVCYRLRTFTICIAHWTAERKRCEYRRLRITYARHTRRLSLIVLLSISMHGCTFCRSRPAAADPRGTDRRTAQHTVNYRTLAYRPTRLNSAVVDLPATQMRRARVLQLPICRANVASYILSKYLQLLSPSTPAG